MTEKGGIGGLGFEQDDLTEQALDLHAPLGVDISLEKGNDVVYNSVSSVSNTGPIEFIIPRDEECSIILDQTRLIGHFVVKTAKDENVGPDDRVFLANNFASNLFSAVEIYINGTQVCDLSTANSYPFKNFIQTELSFDREAKQSQLRAEGYFEEKENDIGACEPGINQRLIHRRNLILHGKKVYFCSRLGADIMYTDKYMPPNVDIKIKLIRNSPTFGILHAEDDKSFKIVLKDLKLKMRKVLPVEQQRKHFRMKMSQQPCYIPFKLSQLKVFVIPAGVTSYTVTNIASQILPKQVIFTLIHNQALTHDSKFNPFDFQHFDLNYFNLIKNGQCVFPKAFQPDFDDDNYMDLYRHMYDSTGFGISNSSCDISPAVFKRGRCFLTADLTPDRCNSFHIHPDEKGKLDLELGFKTAKPHPIYLLAYSIFNSGIKIEENGQVVRAEER